MTPQLPTMTPQRFIGKWLPAVGLAFGEKQASQEMFLDICGLVGHPTPVAYGDADAFTFEKWVPGGFAELIWKTVSAGSSRAATTNCRGRSTSCCATKSI